MDYIIFLTWWGHKNVLISKWGRRTKNVWEPLTLVMLESMSPITSASISPAPGQQRILSLRPRKEREGVNGAALNSSEPHRDREMERAGLDSTEQSP